MLQPSPETIHAGAADLAACASLIRGGSRTFHAASLLLPRRVRQPAYALYAFCRMADDSVDLGGAVDTLDSLRERLARAYQGVPLPLPADRALADAVARFAIPRALPEALLEGFAWDAAGRRYENLGDLRAYASRVAGSVGAMMAILMGVRDDTAIACACDLGIAMQFSNIARDVGEDARAGRLYLPLQWLRDSGIDPDAWMARPVFGPAIAAVVERLLAAADWHYAQADAGITRLPAACRPSIAAARMLYAEIGREVARRDHDSVSARAVVPARRKLWLLVRTVCAQSAAIMSSEKMARSDPPTQECGFLVEAVRAMRASALQVDARRDPQGGFDHKVAWLVDLFTRLEHQERLERQES